jgi:hypothetical protein
MHEVPDLSSKAGGIRRLDRYDQLAEYVFGEWGRRMLGQAHTVQCLGKQPPPPQQQQQQQQLEERQQQQATV